MQIDQWFNFFEGIFWISVGCVFLIPALRRKKGLCGYWLMVGLVFALFGVSDFAEVRTRAWYDPWWLCAWKAGCLAALALLYGWYRRLARKNSNDVN